MGEHNVQQSQNQEGRTKFARHLLDDIKALELLLEKGLIEDDIIRIGAEQEFCLVNDRWRPSMKSDKILEAVNDPHFTTELARYNLEINLDPVELGGSCFSIMEHQLNTLLKKAALEAEKHANKIVLTGILPTISKNELEFDFMTPNPRYKALNDVIKQLRGTDFSLHLKGVDELSIIHDSVLFEACNTSFQLHLQITPDDFISSYNWAQVISGPILGICANSPLLLGRELWNETRIALFQQSIDTRSSSYALKDQMARVSFGSKWATGTVADIFKDDIARYPIILTRDIEEHALHELEQGRIPKLRALCLHNGTVYHWNRACYGVGGGKAHLRIENRYIPSGPSTLDEMANFVFWAGVMLGRPSKFDDMPSCMDFRDAKSNFIKASRTGKESVMRWMGEKMLVSDLITKELLPMAYSGLAKHGVSNDDSNRFLKIIEERTRKCSGAQWIIHNYRHLKKHFTQDDALVALTKNMYEHQQTESPVHEWPLEVVPEKKYKKIPLVSHIMSTRLFSINENDLAELATSIMQWKNIHHVPVENNFRKFTGLLTWSHIERYQKEEKKHEGDLRVSDIMITDVISVTPKTTLHEAKALMQKHEIGCLPVIQDEDLVGIVTQKDISLLEHGEGI